MFEAYSFRSPLRNLHRATPNIGPGPAGTATDAEVAGRLGRKAQQVPRKRLELRIAPAHPRRPWTAQILACLGKLSDVEIARRTG